MISKVIKYILIGLLNFEIKKINKCLDIIIFERNMVCLNDSEYNQNISDMNKLKSIEDNIKKLIIYLNDSSN